MGADVRHFVKESASEVKAGRSPRQQPRTECEVPVCRDMVACVFDKHAMKGSLGVERQKGSHSRVNRIKIRLSTHLDTYASI
jgi:hypothetical protein